MRQNRRRFLQRSFALAAVSLSTACGMVPFPGQSASGAPRVPRIGYLTLTTTAVAELEAVRDGLRELGYVDGQSISIEVRRSESIEQFAAPAGELVALPVDVILTSGGTGSTQAAMDATST